MTTMETNTVELQRYNAEGELVSRTSVALNNDQWRAINFVDYLQFDACGLLMAEFDVHDITARIAMQSYSKAGL